MAASAGLAAQADPAVGRYFHEPNFAAGPTQRAIRVPQDRHQDAFKDAADRFHLRSEAASELTLKPVELQCALEHSPADEDLLAAQDVLSEVLLGHSGDAQDAHPLHVIAV